jgi:predicted nucleotidyltransferase component of viral defense system
MKFTNASSFKAKIKNIANEKGITSQQVQQNYLIEQVLHKIAASSYKSSFIVKGGYLISNIIGVDKRTTMDLDVTLKKEELTAKNLLKIFDEVLIINDNEHGFIFDIDSLQPIRKGDEYGGFEIKLNATFDTLKEVLFIDVTTGDIITPREIIYSLSSVFSNDKIKLLSYNLETIFSEKLEAVLSRGEGSTRPRDRYDLFTLWKLKKEEINLILLKKALFNTSNKRQTINEINNWKEQVKLIKNSDYQRQLWLKYQSSFKYAQGITFEESVDAVSKLMTLIDNVE